MIDWIIGFSIRRRAWVILAGVALAVLGTIAGWRTPVDAIPDLSENQVILSADWPGHSPREVEDQVTYPISIALQGMRGVRVVRSSSDVDYCWVSVIYDDSVDLADARVRLAEKLAGLDLRLPAGVVPRLAPDSAATGQIFWYTVEGRGLDAGRLRAVQDEFVRPRLAAIPGVAEVASVGGMKSEYQVNVNPLRLRARGVALDAVTRAVARSNAAAGGGVIHQANAELLVRSVGWLGTTRDDVGKVDPAAVLRDLEEVGVPALDGGLVRLGDVATVALGPQPRRGVLEKDGVEVTGGVVLMARGENPRDVTDRIKQRIRELKSELPPGVKIVPFYDRTPLIDGAIATVSWTLIEAIATASICVLFVLLHLRTSFVIAITLPLAALGSFLLMWIARATGWVEAQTNIMSLAGIAISIGVLVDSSIVMAENAMHMLKQQYGDRPVRGDVRQFVLPACRAVGRPIFFSIVIMLVSFLPVFALGGMEGKMIRPLALTKSFALIAVACLSITLVPALCTIFIRGRLRGEMESPLVRGVIEVYRPVLGYVMDRPAPLAWILGVTFIVGFCPIGNRMLFLGVLALSIVALGMTARSPLGRLVGMASLVLVALVADTAMTPIGSEFMTPLDEGMVMDMPITVPRISVTESADDLKARDMILCRFPEVDMVVGKAGRAESATDPAPLDMIETMVNFRPQRFWPKRKLMSADARSQVEAVLDALLERNLTTRPVNPAARADLVDRILAATIPQFDALMREFAYQRNQELDRSLAVDPAQIALDGPDASYLAHWVEHSRQLDDELLDRGATTYTRLAIEELLLVGGTTDPRIAAHLAELKRLRTREPRVDHHRTAGHAMSRSATIPAGLEPMPILDGIQTDLSRRFARRLLLWRKERADLIGFGGELDRAVPMPGWINVWTMPIQNRVDMLATGVNTMVGIRVLGRSSADVVRTSTAIAAVVKRIPGAIDVITDPIRGKGYLEVRVDRAKALRLGVDAGDVNDVVETAVGGKVVTTTVEGRERRPVRVRYARDWRVDLESVKRLLVTARQPRSAPRQIPLSEVADVRTVEGPATIKSENGMLRDYVRLNIRGRDAAAFVADARRIVAQRVALPAGTSFEWTGQFEHELRARQGLRLIVPVVLVLILLILYATYHDLADALLMMLAVPGSIAGGAFLQWLLGEKFSVTIWVGYIACLGMATSTGIIMLVYLRESVAKAGGLEHLSREGLRRAVFDGAVHRLRPKLLTEGTTILGLAPMLWAHGVGSEVIRPMAAPVLGGLLVADEVIDLLLPIVFYWVRRRRWERIHHESFEPQTVEVHRASTS